MFAGGGEGGNGGLDGQVFYREVAGAMPVEQGEVGMFGVGRDVELEDRGGSGEGMLAGDEQGVVGREGIGQDGEGGGGRGEQVRGFIGGGETIGAGTRIAGANENASDIMDGDEDAKFVEQAGDGAFRDGRGLVEGSAPGIDDEQATMGAADESSQGIEIFFIEAEEMESVAWFEWVRGIAYRCVPKHGGSIGRDVEGEDARGVGMGAGEGGVEVIEIRVVGRNEDDGALTALRAIGHGLAGGDAGGEFGQELSFAGAGGSVEQGDGATRDAMGPEPGRGGPFEIGEDGDMGHGRDGRESGSGGFSGRRGSGRRELAARWDGEHGGCPFVGWRWKNIRGIGFGFMGMLRLGVRRVVYEDALRIRIGRNVLFIRYITYFEDKRKYF